MTDGDRTDAIAALKRVRAKLESALHADANGQAQALRGSDFDASDHRDDAKMASSPVYKSWALVGEAIEALHAIEDANRSVNRVELRTEGNAAPDDLTCIRGIDTALARHLALLGITRFADIAAWRSDDVRNVSRALGFSREISRQNWIEQAALLERRKATSENATAAPARVPVSELRSDLREIVEPARQETPAGNDAPSPLALELASQTLGERVGATLEAASPVGEESVAPLPSASGAVPRVDRHDTANGAVPAAADAAERARRLADARQRLAQGAERADSERLRDVNEAAVTFVIREPERARQPTFGSSTPRAKPDLRNRLPSAGRSEPGAAAYVASQAVGEEAEVVVVKPQTPHDGAKRPEGGPVRRFLRALTGG